MNEWQDTIIALEEEVARGSTIGLDIATGEPCDRQRPNSVCGQDTIIALEEEVARGGTVGLDIATGEPCDPATAGIYDNYLVKRQARCAYREVAFTTAFCTPSASEMALCARDKRTEGRHCIEGTLLPSSADSRCPGPGRRRQRYNLCLVMYAFWFVQATWDAMFGLSSKEA